MKIEFQVENWSDVYAELETMFSQLWNDVGVDKDRFTAKCERAKYDALEKAGALCVTTARHDGKLVGYYVAIILSNPHYADQGLMAYTDMYFLLPTYRCGNTGMRLFQFAEKAWRERGAVKAYTSHKIHRDRSKMFAVLGWKPLDVLYSKVLA